MGANRDWVISAQRNDGTNLSKEEIQEIRNAFGDNLYEYYDKGTFEFGFATTSFFAEDDMLEILSSYCPTHPNITVTVHIHYDTDDAPVMWESQGSFLKVYEPRVVYDQFEIMELPIKRKKGFGC